MAGREGFYVVAGPEFQRVANELRQTDSQAPTRLRAAMKRAAAPIVAEVKRQALALPASGTRHTGLRRRLARSVSVQASTGRNARMRFVTRMPEPDEAALPRGMDSGPSGWRHPVFGQTDTWVQQRGYSWFREPIAEGRDLIEDNLQEVLQDAAERIADAGGIA